MCGNEKNGVRALGGPAPGWEDTNLWVGALAARLTMLPLSMTASTVRTMWNKLWIGTNRTKTKGLTPAQEQFLGQCEFCGADNQDEDHLIRHCPAPAFAAIRLAPNSTPTLSSSSGATLLALLRADNSHALSEMAAYGLPTF